MTSAYIRKAEAYMKEERAIFRGISITAEPLPEFIPGPLHLMLNIGDGASYPISAKDAEDLMLILARVFRGKSRDV